MIRVFYENGCGVEFENNLKEQINTETCNGNIVKVIKQVKDLTKQEIYKYVMLNFANVEHIDIFADCIVVVLGGKDMPQINIVLNNDDYVDVTKYIKGE